MKRCALALALTTGSLPATGCLEWISDIGGWMYAGPTGKYNRLKTEEFSLNEGTTPQIDFNHTHLNSIGVQAGVGLVFPIPFFFAADGAFTKLYSCTFKQKTLLSGSTSFLTTGFEGEFYTYEFKGGYLFYPLCDTPWTLYPLFAYNTDSISTIFPNLPFNFPSDITVHSFDIRSRFSFNGPAVGLGTTLTLPYGFSFNAEAVWQWRLYKSTSKNRTELLIPGSLIFDSKQHSGAMAWTQGPKLDLSLDYFFCNWFFGVTGEWQYLQQFKKSEGEKLEVDVIIDPKAKTVIHREVIVSPLITNHLEWSNWVWKASIGFIF